MPRRRVACWFAIGCMLLGAACSSGSDGDSSAGGSSTGPPSEQDAEAGGGNRSANPDLVDGPVCDVIDPVVDEITAATALDVALGDDSPSSIPASGCRLMFEGSDISLVVTIGRAPAILSTVEAMVAGLQDAVPVRALPSLGDDAQLVRDGIVDSTAYVLFSSNGRVWQVTVADGLAGSIDGPGPDTEQIAAAVAEVVHARLET